jgi:ribosomal protein S4E
VKRLENILVGSTFTIIGHYYLEKRDGKEGLLIVTKKYAYTMMEQVVIDVNTMPIHGHININY